MIDDLRYPLVDVIIFTRRSNLEHKAHTLRLATSIVQIIIIINIWDVIILCIIRGDYKLLYEKS